MTHDITLSDEELDEMQRILTARLREMLVEIHHTDSRPFRSQLQRQFETCQRIARAIVEAREHVAAS
jgi:aminoglycoside phosphotransferase (APT) family kinase protein